MKVLMDKTWFHCNHDPLLYSTSNDFFFSCQLIFHSFDHLPYCCLLSFHLFLSAQICRLLSLKLSSAASKSNRSANVQLKSISFKASQLLLVIVLHFLHSIVNYLHMLLLWLKITSVSINGTRAKLQIPETQGV